MSSVGAFGGKLVIGPENEFVNLDTAISLNVIASKTVTATLTTLEGTSVLSEAVAVKP